jgi:hypothetical protein
MQTGYNVVRDSHPTAHMQAIITGATTVLMQELTRDFYRLVSLTGDSDYPEMMQSCAYRFLQSTRCRRLQAIVETFLASADETPTIDDQEMLQEILAVYEQARTAGEQGNLAEFRTNTLVPCVQMQAAHTCTMPEEDARAFLAEINANRAEAVQFEPTTPFERIVYSCIISGPEI